METFQFYSKLDLTILLGRKAKNVPELLESIKSVPDSSIYYHTHKFLQRHHYLSTAPSNDFAYWTGKILNRSLLGERLSSIDIVQFHSLSELRKQLIEIIESHLQITESDITPCPPGNEFHFMASQVFAFPNNYIASNLSELREHLEHISADAIYHHFFDVKLRSDNDENDFSNWFRKIGKPELAEAVKRLDPYAYSLEGLRKRLIVLVRAYDTN
ncbi:MAG: hypothetical protein EPO24_13470 [Bacteroidetes bacterium]|nr:MAG: hypothetical protein EPO24_13470 [Bacteroidota bacterium]